MSLRRTRNENDAQPSKHRQSQVRPTNIRNMSPTAIIFSDTHGDDQKYDDMPPVDVAIHCGDMTEESKLDEYSTTIDVLKSINAPLKLVIAGNHDFTLDPPGFKKRLDELKVSVNVDQLLREWGPPGRARELFEADEVKDAGIVFLDEGVHQFHLENGTTLTVYASPFTPSTDDPESSFGYSPNSGHDWTLINSSFDVVATHGPPKGVLDHTRSGRAGCPHLFGAIARARPQLHCFGHIHGGWGAKKVTWRSEPSESPSFFTDIDNNESEIIASLANLRPSKFDSADQLKAKDKRRKMRREKGYYEAAPSLKSGLQTLFVNAAIQEDQNGVEQLPWIVEIELPITKSKDVPSWREVPYSKNGDNATMNHQEGQASTDWRRKHVLEEDDIEGRKIGCRGSGEKGCRGS